MDINTDTETDTTTTVTPFKVTNETTLEDIQKYREDLVIRYFHENCNVDPVKGDYQPITAHALISLGHLVDTDYYSEDYSLNYYLSLDMKLSDNASIETKEISKLNGANLAQLVFDMAIENYIQNNLVSNVKDIPKIKDSYFNAIVSYCCDRETYAEHLITFTNLHQAINKINKEH